MHRYESVARKLATHIRAGRLLPGDRLPSVRRLCRQEAISVSTAMHAYELLEREGLVRARPQSGYFVEANVQAPPEPAESRPPVRVRFTDHGEAISDLLKIARNESFVPFSAAIPPPELLPVRQLNRITAALCRRADHPGIRYDLPPGNPDLRRQLSRRALDWGCQLTPDDFVITSGCMEALNLALRAVAPRPGAVIAVESPAYYGVLMAIASFGHHALEVPTHPAGGVVLGELEALLKKQRVDAALFAPNFTNPVGALMSDEGKAALVELLARHNIPLIEDDIYGDLCFSRQRPRTAKSFDTRGQVLLCSSFSKSLAPGYRVGYIVPGRYAREVERLKFVSTMATNSLGSLAIAGYLYRGGYETHLRELCRAFEDQTLAARTLIGQHFPRGTRVSRPQGGFVLWVELPRGHDAFALYQAALRERIGILPGHIFSNTNRYRHCFRISCGQPWSERNRRALVRLGELAGA